MTTDRPNHHAGGRARRFAKRAKVMAFGGRYWAYGLRIRPVAYGLVVLIPTFFLVGQVWSPGEQAGRDLLWLFGASAQVFGALFAFVLVIGTFQVQSMQSRLLAAVQLIRENVAMLRVLAETAPESFGSSGAVLRHLAHRLSCYSLADWPDALQEDKEALDSIRTLAEAYGERKSALTTEEERLYERIGALTIDIEMLCNRMRIDTTIQTVWATHGLWARPLVELLALTLIALAMCVAISAEVHTKASGGATGLICAGIYFLYLSFLVFLNLWSDFQNRICRSEVQMAAFRATDD